MDSRDVHPHKMHMKYQGNPKSFSIPLIQFAYRRNEKFNKKPKAYSRSQIWLNRNTSDVRVHLSLTLVHTIITFWSNKSIPVISMYIHISLTSILPPLPAMNSMHFTTGRVRLIRSHSSARFSFELSGNLNYRLFFNSNFAKNIELENSLN